MGNSLAENIRFYRKKNKLTQSQLADELFVAPQTVSKWESGISEPDTEKLCSIADLFGVSVDNLVRGSNVVERNAFIAIDGGGTKTAFLLFDENGVVLDRLTLGGTNPNTYGLEASQKVLSDGIDKLISSGYTVKGLYAGISGASVGENKEILQKFLKSRYPYIMSRVEGDIYNVINSAGRIEKCIAVISGTGSVVYGYDGHTLHRAGGWGYLFDEAGSGFDMGRELFRYCLECEDKKEKKGALYNAVCQEVGGCPIFDQLSVIYTKGKDYIASFSRIVLSFYENNDPIATSIVEKTVDRIAELVNQVHSIADCGNCVVVAGGLTARADLLEPLLKERLGERFNIIIPTMPPIYGAAIRCAHVFQAEIDKEILKNGLT